MVLRHGDLYLIIFNENLTDFNQNMCFCRDSRPEVFYKKGVLRSFAKFTGKHLCQSLFFNKVAGLTPATLLRKRLLRRCFPVNFANFSYRTPSADACVFGPLKLVHLQMI